MNSYLLADFLNKSQNRFLVWLAIILLFLIVVIGLLAETIAKHVERKSHSVDLYVTDYCKYGILKTPEDVSRYVRKRESKNLYLKNRWFLRVFILVLLVFILIVTLTDSFDFTQVKQIISDLDIDLEWPKSKFYFFKNFPTDFPKITKSAVVHLDFLGYSTYIMLLTTITTIVALIIHGIDYVAKLARMHKIKIDCFQKTVNTDNK